MLFGLSSLTEGRLHPLRWRLNFIKNEKGGDLNIFCGIDNGITGAICIWNPDNNGGLRLYPMPILSDGKRRRIDTKILNNILWPYRWRVDVFVVYEAPGGSQSVKAAVSMADSFARIESVLILGGFKREPVNARKWQKMFWAVPKMPKETKFDTKAAALNVAKRLWPEQSWLRTDRCRKPDSGLVDSALIAEYCRRNYTC